MACSCHVDAMVLRRCCHAIAMSLPPWRPYHGNNTLQTHNTQPMVMTPVATCMPRSWLQHGSSMATSCQHHGNTMEVTLQYYCHAITMPCYCDVFAMGFAMSMPRHTTSPMALWQPCGNTLEMTRQQPGHNISSAPPTLCRE